MRSRSIASTAVAVALILFIAPLDSVSQTKVQRPAPGGALDVPLSLEDPDGQGLAIESLSVRTAISGMLSLTEVDVVFRNPQERRIEGRFDATLPANASISRFAKEINGSLMEGEVVERLRANQVYEQFLHQMRDPALLEQDQGNRFSARIFPIEAGTSVRILLSYTQLLESRDGRRTWMFPLRGLRGIGAFSFRAAISPLPGESSVSNARGIRGSGATVSTTDVVTREERDYTPDHDLELSWNAPAMDPLTIVRSSGYYVASIRLPAKATTPEPAVPIVAYVDTSASSGASADFRIDAIERFFASLPAGQRVELLAFDLSVVPLVSGSAADVASKLPTLLRTRHFLGGTDLGLVADDIASRAEKSPAQRFLIVSDGIATLGDTSDTAILDRLRNLRRVRLDVLVIGGRQAPLARRLTDGRGRVLSVALTESFRDAASHAATEFLEPLGETVTLTDANAEWLFPTSIADLRPGREAFVLGKLKTGRAASSLRIGGPAMQFSDGTAIELPNRGFDLLVEREAWMAYLDYLGDRAANEPDAAIRSGIERQRTQISIERRIVIPSTTMLVLESELDYQRFGLDRRSLASILSIGPSGIETLKRTGANVAPPPPPPPPVVKQNRDFGTETLRGTVRKGSRVVTGALVRISGVALNSPRETHTDNRGGYELTRLPPGEYSVRFESAGSVRIDSVVILSGRAARLDATLGGGTEDTRPRGSLFGVASTEGAPLPGVTITATGTDFQAVAVSNAAGEWSLTVPEGRFTLRADMSGMSPRESSAMVRRGLTTRVDISLSLNAMAEAITVTGEARPEGDLASIPDFNAESAGADGPITVTAASPSVLETTEVQSNYDARLVEELPVARSTVSAGSLAPATGSAPPPPPAPQTPPAVNAARPVPATVPDTKSDTSWTRGISSANDTDRLEKAIHDNPKERANYTALSELLASSKQWRRLYDLAIRWQPYDPENPQVYEMLGEAALEMGHHDDAARAFASIVEIAASRPELLQRAGLLLLRAGAGAVAEAPLRKALELRPDRVNAHRHLALFLWKEKRFEEAAVVLEQALGLTFPGWYGEVRRILSEELGYIYRAWAAADPSQRRAIDGRAREHAIDLARIDALRVTLAWDTDATDVDLHVVDPAGEECYYAHSPNASGLQLYGDVTQGLGPEVVRTSNVVKGTYAIGVNYFAAGPMGVSRGIVTIIRTDRRSADPEVTILPFRLVEDSRGKDLRLVGKVTF